LGSRVIPECQSCTHAQAADCHHNRGDVPAEIEVDGKASDLDGRAANQIGSIPPFGPLPLVAQCDMGAVTWARRARMLQCKSLKPSILRRRLATAQTGFHRREVGSGLPRWLSAVMGDSDVHSPRGVLSWCTPFPGNRLTGSASRWRFGDSVNLVPASSHSLEGLGVARQGGDAARVLNTTLLSLEFGESRLNHADANARGASAGYGFKGYSTRAVLNAREAERLTLTNYWPFPGIGAVETLRNYLRRLGDIRIVAIVLSRATKSSRVTK